MEDPVFRKFRANHRVDDWPAVTVQGNRVTPTASAGANTTRWLSTVIGGTYRRLEGLTAPNARACRRGRSHATVAALANRP